MADRHDDRLYANCLGAAFLAGSGTAVLSAVTVMGIHAASGGLLPPGIAILATSPTILIWGTAFVGAIVAVRNARREHRLGGRSGRGRVAGYAAAFATLSLLGPSLGCLPIPYGEMSPTAAHLLQADRMAQVAASLAFAGLTLARHRRMRTGTDPLARA